MKPPRPDVDLEGALRHWRKTVAREWRYPAPMKPGISKQQRALLTLLAAKPPPGWSSSLYPRPAWPVRELRRVFMPNGAALADETRAIEQAEHSTRRAIRALAKRGLVEKWDSVFEARILGAKVTWVEASEHIPGRTERMVGVTLTDAGVAELAEEKP